MGVERFTEYCAFTKAIEHLGDRWSLLVLRQLLLAGPTGFNGLAAALPGRVSRSVLADRLRRLEALGLISQATERYPRHAPYQLTTAGSGLAPTLVSLRDWAGAWLPEDPAMVERDPDVVFAWLAERLDRARLPERQVVLEISARSSDGHRSWIVLERGSAPYGCLRDPLLDQSRYVYLTVAMPVLLALARGRLDSRTALADGSVQAYGHPELTRHLAGWFLPADEVACSGRT